MRGRNPGHGFECTGAELIYAMDQLERIDPEAGKLLWMGLGFTNAAKQVISKHIIASLANKN